MAIRAVGSEGDDHLRSNAPQVAHDLAGRLGGVSLVQVAVDVVEEGHVADAQRVCRVVELACPQLTQRTGAGIVGGVALPAALATRRREEVHFDVLGGIPGERAARAERLVVGMGKDGQQLEFCRHRLSPVRTNQGDRQRLTRGASVASMNGARAASLRSCRGV
ncbi:MAG: hypothetical protein AVDCRST_MAG26-952 [uncultured Chloroflexia bacterium]|uniref:Uncharacterized protein n=1 Tax=uncultured Chloroflexia bacterium TaxID=1672391 RepID=A0A6J4HRA6_9CHLR|nr:MAG: hypothetical protein AVDCRST_MAG26-952 [uncultured Chloroflexia bacterium]